MAALDFPNSPTTNQQYAAPNGVTYQWDGAAWIVTGGPPGQLWTGGTGTLTPTDTTKRVVIPGTPASAAEQGSAAIFGTQTVKGRLIQQPTVNFASLTANAYLNASAAWAQDDATKTSWLLRLGVDTDTFQVYHATAGGSPGVNLSLSASGILDFYGGYLRGASSRFAVSATTSGVDIGHNHDTNYPIYDQTLAGWTIRMGYGVGDGFAVFRRTPNSTTDVSVLQIDNAGKTGLGGTATTLGGRICLAFPKDTGHGLWIQQVNSDTAGNSSIVFANTGNAVSGYIIATATATSYATSSDYRLKTDVTPLVDALATVLALRPVAFRWVADGSPGQGFIAHEAAAIVPQAVSGEKDAVNDNGEIMPQGMDASKLVVWLVGALQELAARVTHLEGLSAAHA